MEKKKYATIAVEKEIINKLKIKATMHGLTMKDYIAYLVEQDKINTLN